MKRALEILAFLLIVAMVICGVVVVDAAADKLEQRAELAWNPKELYWISEQFEEEPVLYEDPQESEKIEAAINWHYIEACELTAYCPCETCCGCYALNRPNGIVYTASGAEAQAGHTIAVDPDVIPLGSWVEINGHQYHAEDTGDFSGAVVDLYFDSHEDALQFGRQVKGIRWYV